MTGTDSAGIARSALAQASEIYADDPVVLSMLAERAVRLDEPLRVAVIGKVKAGKSTLLNALIGEEIAPTDAGECTRVLTYYEYGHKSSVTIHPVSGPPEPASFSRVDGRLQIDLGDHHADDIARLVIRWPSQSLRGMTLLDTPGIDSISTEIAARTLRAFDPQQQPAAADAIIYCMRHLHATDLAFLQSMRDQFPEGADMISTLAVLSRADEIGAGRIDAIISAHQVADRYAADESLRALCQTVLPLAGLLAVSARTLRQTEFAALLQLAESDHTAVKEMLLSADRFRRPEVAVGLPRATRIDLLDRFGIFGIRMAIAMIRGGMVTSSLLAAELARRSGLDVLRSTLFTLFTERGEQLKVRSTLLALASLLEDQPRPGSETLASAIEEVLVGAHQFRELRLIAELRGAASPLPEQLAQEASVLLGSSGASMTQRLSLETRAPVVAQAAAASAALATWRRRASEPINDAAATAACDAVCRTCEGMLDDLEDLLALATPSASRA